MRNKREKKQLDWHLGDFEQRFGFSGGKYTDVNMFFATLLAGVLTALFYIGLCHVPAAVREISYIQMLLNRGWTPYAMFFLAVLAGCILFIKWRKLEFQKRAFRLELIPMEQSFALTPETAVNVIAKLNSLVDEPKRFVLFNRIERALLNLKNIGNLSDVSEMLRAQAENDENHAESSYGILTGIVWVIPILGFIGTVIGLSGAIGGFGTVLGADATVESLRSALAPVTSNLGIAFDTTFVALIFAMVIQLLVTVLRKKEDQFLDACRDYAHVNVISKLRMKDDAAA